MKKNLLSNSSFYLFLIAGIPMKTCACDPDADKSIVRLTSSSEQMAEEIDATSPNTPDPETAHQWKKIIKTQGFLKIPQCKEAATIFYKAGNMPLSAELFRHYLQENPTGDDPQTYHMAARALQLVGLNSHASQAWDQYFHLTTSPNAVDYLHAGRTYFSRGREASSKSCFRAYIAHPDFEETSKKHLFETAEAYIHLGDFNKSTHFWTLYFSCKDTKPTYFDYTNAAFAFEKAQQHKESSRLWKKAFTFKKMEIDVSTFMSALTSFNEIEDHDSMLWLLDKMPKRMTNPPSQIYRQAANIYQDLQKDEKAAHMWDQFFLHPDSQPEPKDYASAARAYFHTLQSTRAHEMWEKYFSHTDIEFENRNYKSFAMVLSALGKYEESIAIWSKFSNKDLSKDMLLHAVYARDLCALGRYVEAACQYDCCFDQLVASKDNSYLIYATLAYLMSGEFDKALKVHNTRVAFGFLPNKMLIYAPKTPTSSKTTKKRNTKRNTKRNKSNIGPEMIQSIKLSIGQNDFERATTYYNQAKNVTYPELQALREELMTQYNTCLIHYLALKKESAVKTPTVSQAPTSSSHVSSSSSSSSQDVSTSSSSDFQSLQHMVTRMENTYASFSRKHEALKSLERKQQYKERLQKFEHTTSSPFEDRKPSKQNLRSEYPREPKKRSASSGITLSQAVMSTSTSTSSSSSSSTSPSISTDEVIPQPIQWHITPAALGQYESLSTSQLSKFNHFKSEIAQNPWLDQSITGTFSGRAKQLKGFSNLFSRRFDHKNRFVYRVEDLSGSIRVTVLGLLTHYKALER